MAKIYNTKLWGADKIITLYICSSIRLQVWILRSTHTTTIKKQGGQKQYSETAASSSSGTTSLLIRYIRDGQHARLLSYEKTNKWPYRWACCQAHRHQAPLLHNDGPKYPNDICPHLIVLLLPCLLVCSRDPHHVRRRIYAACLPWLEEEAMMRRRRTLTCSPLKPPWPEGARQSLGWRTTLVKGGVSWLPLGLQLLHLAFAASRRRIPAGMIYRHRILVGHSPSTRPWQGLTLGTRSQQVRIAEL